ncbi:MAG: hypothetical protein A2096_03630 [Spirochaetes bacterium GWF1_41_5]|nr:MAG: hypothetical protein A2096_03630 [Spirochaetes bacterium GWF1_41_5]HBE02947.1 hypothetical protein [Spirochaetia bacterium]
MILIVDDEENIRKVLKGLLGQNGYKDIMEAADGIAAFNLLQEYEADLIICDYKMPGMNGMELFRKLDKRNFLFILLTAHGTIDLAVQAVKEGVYDFITKPFDEKVLVRAVKKALNEQKTHTYEIQPEKSNDDFFTSRHEEITALGKTVSRLARIPANVLINGSTGTGKSLLAGIIHETGPLCRGPFIKINCGAIPEPLMESELFGYCKGAFTGALIDKPGKFELADGGSIFLDEIGELDITLQSKLLTVIQEHEIFRLGDIQSRKVSCRIIAASNKNLKELSRQGAFREDLYYRLAVAEITMPDLKNRKLDISGLVQKFMKKYCREYSLAEKTFSSEALLLLENYSWPGNIRELDNLVQKLLIMEDKNPVNAACMENWLTAGKKPEQDLRQERARSEAEHIKKILLAAENNRTRAAEMLGISRRTLLYRLKEYGI